MVLGVKFLSMLSVWSMRCRVSFRFFLFLRLSVILSFLMLRLLNIGVLLRLCGFFGLSV